MINVLLVSYSVIAALIGAGFASGQEILLYFSCFGKYGIIGVCVTVVSFGIFSYAVLNACYRYKYTNFDSFLGIFKSQIIRIFVKAITILFSFAVYGAMLSAAGEMIYEFFGCSKAIATLLCTICAVLLFMLADEKVFTLNGILGIALVIAITFSVLYMLCYREYHAFSPIYTKSVNSGLIYSGYNLVSMTPVFVALSKKLNSKTDCISVSFCISIMSAIIMALIFGLISIYANKIDLGELPMLTLAKRQNTGFASLYATILTVAIVTTLISSGGALCNALRIRKKLLPISLVSSGAYLFSGFGFSTVINTAYRLCGIGGFIACLAIVFACFSQPKTRKEIFFKKYVF